MGKATFSVVRADLFADSVTVMAGLGYGYGPTTAVQAHFNIQLAPAWGWPYDPMVMPYWVYWYSPCYPSASCVAYSVQLSPSREPHPSERNAEEGEGSGFSSAG
jgi:hypothetical protein